MHREAEITIWLVTIIVYADIGAEWKLTNGVKYWKLFGSYPSFDVAALSRRTNEISIIRVNPAAMRV
jgi:hypothetical protein